MSVESGESLDREKNLAVPFIPGNPALHQEDAVSTTLQVAFVCPFQNLTLSHRDLNKTSVSSVSSPGLEPPFWL